MVFILDQIDLSGDDLVGKDDVSIAVKDDLETKGPHIIAPDLSAVSGLQMHILPFHNQCSA